MLAFKSAHRIDSFDVIEDLMSVLFSMGQECVNGSILKNTKFHSELVMPNVVVLARKRTYLSRNVKN